MTFTRKLTVPNGEEVKRAGIKVLIETLGITKTAFFIRQTMAQTVDYLEMKEELFGNKTAAELYAEMQAESGDRHPPH
jgi:hypothetical protein